MVQLYFIEKDKEQIEKQLNGLRKRVDEAREARMDFEKNIGERQKVCKKLLREKQEIERRLGKEVFYWILLYKIDGKLKCPNFYYLIIISINICTFKDRSLISKKPVCLIIAHLFSFGKK
jgi:hypothetical protein